MRFSGAPRVAHRVGRYVASADRRRGQLCTVMNHQCSTYRSGKVVQTNRATSYIPLKGGGDVAVQLVGKHIDSTVNNPIEAESHWRSGALRPLCVMDKERLPYKAKLTTTQSWNDVPTCTSAGLPVEYLMLRGIFMPPGVTPDQVKYYVDLFNKVRSLPEWKDFMEKGAFKQTVMSGDEYVNWLGQNEQAHRVLMRDAGFLAN